MILPYVLHAGEEIMSIYHTDFKVYHKSEHDPVTDADLLASEIIVASIRTLFPEDGVISEEIAPDADRLDKKRIWILDPIDGTREFVEKTNEFSITLGLSVDGQATVGITLNPALCSYITSLRFALPSRTS